MTWPTVKLGEVLTRRKDEVLLNDLTIYPRLTIRLNGRGIEVRDKLLGVEIGTKRQFIARTGQLVLSKIDARNGAFGILPPEGEQAIITGNFWAFDHNPERLDLRFLEYLTKTKSFVEFCVRASEGTTNRRYLQEDLFLGESIPQPPLAEQRRLVARIDALAAKIDEAKRLREEASENANRMLICMAHRQDWSDEQKIRAGWTLTEIGRTVTLRPAPVKVDTTINYPNLGIYSFGRGLFEKQPIEGIATSATTLFRVRAGQFIYSRLFAFEGSYGIVPPELDGRFVSNEYPTFDCEDTKVRPEFLEAYFKGPEVWQCVAVGSKGLGDRRQRVQPEQVLAHKFWLPPLWWQNHIAEARSKLVGVALKRESIETKLNALLPAILDRAFRGEL